ncbi:uncharacterized protein [Apostichopus japonicus]|uniref:uncharacterized protein isoform X1 n=1 Tax=Stichopus japonicus TaxID=307972 RepID=UPI003AB82912
MKNHMWHLLFIFLLVALWSGNLVYATGCADRPCQNGGVCFDQPNNDFICLCIVGFTGRTCIGDVETPSPAAETMATTTVQASTTTQATTTVPTTIKETTEASTKQPTTSSSTSSSHTSSTEAAVSEKKSTDSSDNSSGDQDGDGDSGDVTSTTMLSNNEQENTSKDKVSGDRGKYKWFLFLILLVLLVAGSLVTMWAIRRSAKSHGKYNPNAAFMAYALDAERAPPSSPSPSTNGSFGGPVD